MLNPLLTKELRDQARNPRIYAVGIILIFFLSALAFGLIWGASTTQKALKPEYSRGIFFTFVLGLVVFISLVFPAFTVGAIPLEQEHHTFDLLRATLLKPRQILLGKVSPVIIHILIILFATTPIILPILSLGGISFAEVARCYLLAFVSAVTFSLVGLMCSSIFINIRTSALVTYSITGFFVFGTVLVPMILRGVFKIKAGGAILDFCTSLNILYAVANIFGRTKHFQFLGMSSWSIAIVGCIIVFMASINSTLIRFRKYMG